MNIPDRKKTKVQLIEEVETLRRQVVELQAVEARDQQAQKVLHESLEQYRQLFENVTDALVTTSFPDGRIVAVNHAFERILGFSREEGLGRHYSSFLTPASFLLAEKRTREALAGKSLPSLFEVEAIRKDGTIVPIEARVRFLYDTDARVIGLHGSYRDISEQKRAEEAIRTLNVELEQRKQLEEILLAN
jgi:PAS domain S-box-containing protein